MHLYRGALFVRNWSRYKTTVTGWTLCGMNRNRKTGVDPPPATEDASRADCWACRVLMPPGRAMGPFEGIGKNNSEIKPQDRA